MTKYASTILILNSLNISSLLVSFLLSLPKFRLLHSNKSVVRLLWSCLSERFLRRLIEEAFPRRECIGTLLELKRLRQTGSIDLEEITSSSKWCCRLECLIIPCLRNITLSLAQWRTSWQLRQALVPTFLK